MAVVTKSPNIILGAFTKKVPTNETKIDLAWAKEHIAGFAKYKAQADDVKASEAEYKKLLKASPK